MRAHRVLPVMVLLSFAVAACCTLRPGCINTSEVKDVVEMVAERHDVYVLGDESLTDAETSLYLLESKDLVTFVNEKPDTRRSEFKSMASDVCDRHDEYVKGDDAVSELRERTWLRSTDTIRSLFPK